MKETDKERIRQVSRDLAEALGARCKEKDYQMPEVLEFHMAMTMGLGLRMEVPIKEFNEILNEMKNMYEQYAKAKEWA